MGIALQTTYTQAPAIGFAGMLEGSYPNDIWTLKNAEVSTSMPFGLAVAFKTSSPATDKDAVVMAGGRTAAGIVVHSHAYAPAFTAGGVTVGDLDTVGLRPGVMLNILRKGKILVNCMTGCAVGDRLFICTAANVTYTAVGQLGNADESSNTLDSTKQGQWLTSATAGNLAWLSVDFDAKP